MAPSVPHSKFVAGWGQTCWMLVEGCFYYDGCSQLPLPCI